MIIFVLAGLLFVGFFSFMIWAESKGECKGCGAVSLTCLMLFIFSLYLFASSKYPQPKETIYPINIAPNHIAFITDGENLINISCIVKQNVTSNDKYVRVEYPGYWTGYIYVDGKTEHKILRPSEELIP